MMMNPPVELCLNMGGRGVQFRSILFGMCIHSLSVILFDMHLHFFEKLGMKLFICVNKASLLFEIYLYLIVPIGFHMMDLI